MGTEPGLPRTLFCREGSFPRVDGVISACGGKGREKREEERARMVVPALPKPREHLSLGAQSVRCPGEWREVRCLLCQGKMNRRLPAHGGTNCCDLVGLHFPCFRRLLMSGCANTDVDTIKQNEPVHATVLTCLLNLRDMRSDQRALRLEVKKQIIKYLDSDLSFCPDLA